MKKTFKFSIRKKLLLLSIAVLSLPYVGYQYVREMEQYLRDGLEISLAGTASSIAGLLSGRDALFPQSTNRSDPPLFVHEMKQVVQIDGYTEEWDNWLEWANDLTSIGGSANARIILAEREGYFYVLCKVDDDRVVYQRPDQPFTGKSDQIELFTRTSDGEKHHYWIAPEAPGHVSAYEQSMVWNEELWEEEPVPRSVTNLSGVWQESDRGYSLELKIPSYMVGSTFGLMITDVDDTVTRRLQGRISTFNGEEPNSLVRASDTIGRVLNQFSLTDGRRVWVLDMAGNVLATYGSLKKPTNHKNLLSRLYTLILPAASTRFKDDLAGASRLQGEDVSSALQGQAGIRWRSSPDGKAAIVTAAQPIRSGSRTIGAVVAEETTGNIQTVQRKAMADLFTRSVLVFVGVTAILLLFASSLSRRIRRLSREADEAIDERGRVAHTQVGKPWRDELGDLASHYSKMLERLKEYNDYLESLASKLSHELRTPMAVVQSSLESLQFAENPEDADICLKRAQQGIQRLQKLVTRLSEAARLESALYSSEMEPVWVDQLLRSCIDGYRVANPGQEFICRLETKPGLQLQCVPDLIVQMLDKLVSNAVDFAHAGTPITIWASEHDGNLKIKIINLGPPLPEELQKQIFNSMVSRRDARDRNEPHLGLGLYIANHIAEFHGGELEATNLESREGVCFTVRLPLYG